MEVKGHQRSNVLNYVLWLPNLVRRFPDASLWWWWWPSWRSKVIRGQMRKLCAMGTKPSQKKPWCKFIMMMTFMKVKGHQRSNVVNFALWLPNLVKRIANASLNDGDLHGGQRSNGTKYSKLCSMATNVARRSLMIIITSLGLKHHQTIKMVTSLKRMLPPNLARALAKGTVMSCYYYYHHRHHHHHHHHHHYYYY